MLSKAEKNLYLNIALLILGTISVLTGLALSIKIPALMPFLRSINIKNLHEWISYALTIFVVLHLLSHIDWIKVMLKNKFLSKKAIRQRLDVGN